MIAYDKRGHGLSSVGRSPYSMDDHVEDLEALLDHLNVKGAVICGVSVGGMIAQGLYAKRPDLVSMLVLCDTAHKIGTPEIWNERIAEVEENGFQDLAEIIMERWFTPDFHEKHPAALQGYFNMLTRQTVEGYAGTCAAIRDADYTQEAGEIKVPTLCVVGDQDGSTPPDLVEEFAGLVSGAKFEIIPGAGHLPSIEQPELLCRIMKKFMVTNLFNAANTNGSGNA
jgi:3-oxoadipate enol-lactonase